MTPVAMDLSHRFLNSLGDGKYRFTFIDRAIIEKVTHYFIEGRTCLIRHSGRAFVALEVTDAFGGRYNLTVIETKLELAPELRPE